MIDFVRGVLEIILTISIFVFVILGFLLPIFGGAQKIIQEGFFDISDGIFILVYICLSLVNFCGMLLKIVQNPHTYVGDIFAFIVLQIIISVAFVIIVLKFRAGIRSGVTKKYIWPGEKRPPDKK